MKCETCKNKPICKYTEDYKKAETEIKIMIHPIVSTVTITCGHFQEDRTERSQYGINLCDTPHL